MDIIPERLAALPSLHLESGAHKDFESGACALEVVSWLVGSDYSDHPECVCPVLGAFVRAWNDGLPDDERDAILKPILPRLIGTRGGNKLAERRSLMAADWLVRVHTPAWLRLAKLDAHADALAGLPEITSMAQVPSIRGPIEAAQRDAYAAWEAARDAGGDVAVTAAWNAAVTAAVTAAWAVGGAAAVTAAEAAGGAVAGAVAVDALKETRLALQRSAAELVIRMIDRKGRGRVPTRSKRS